MTSGLRARPQSLKLAQDGHLKPGRDWDVSGSWQGLQPSLHFWQSAPTVPRPRPQLLGTRVPGSGFTGIRDLLRNCIHAFGTASVPLKPHPCLPHCIHVFATSSTTSKLAIVSTRLGFYFTSWYTISLRCTQGCTYKLFFPPHKPSYLCPLNHAEDSLLLIWLSDNAGELEFTLHGPDTSENRVNTIPCDV